MGQKKLIRFAELKSFPNVLEFPKEVFNNEVFNLAIAQEELGRTTIEKTTAESPFKEGAARFYHPLANQGCSFGYKSCCTSEPKDLAEVTSFLPFPEYSHHRLHLIKREPSFSVTKPCVALP